MLQLPVGGGGDTMFASGYEAYDRMSPAVQRLAEGLTSTHYQPFFDQVKAEKGEEYLHRNRGSPENSSLDFTAEQSVYLKREGGVRRGPELCQLTHSTARLYGRIP